MIDAEPIHAPIRHLDGRPAESPVTARLCDLSGRRLVIVCEPCGRRGVYDLSRLKRRYGEHADLYDLFVSLTQTCRYQHRTWQRRPNQYGRACRAHAETDGADSRTALPSRT